jgi:hypothetical protein
MSATGMPLVQLVNIIELICQIMVPIVQRNYSERIQCQGKAFSSSNDRGLPLGILYPILTYFNILI